MSNSKVLDGLTDDELILLGEFRASHSTSLPNNIEWHTRLVETARSFISTGHKLSLESLTLAARKLEGEYQAQAQVEHQKLVAVSQVFENWAIKRDGDWPNPTTFGGQALPKNEQTGQRLLDTVEKNGWDWSEQSFDRALHVLHINALFTAPAVREFVRDTNPALRNAQGQVGYTNMYNILDAVLTDPAFRGQVTKKNLDAALYLLHSRGQIQWEKALPTADAIRKRNEARDATDRVANNKANTFGPKEPEKLKVSPENDAFAKNKINKAYHEASSLPLQVGNYNKSLQELTLEVVRAHQAAHVDSPLTLNEVGALHWVILQLNNPPGESHVDRNAARAAMQKIIAQEYRGVINASGLAPWERAARQIQGYLDKNFSRSITG